LYVPAWGQWCQADRNAYSWTLVPEPGSFDVEIATENGMGKNTTAVEAFQSLYVYEWRSSSSSRFRRKNTTLVESQIQIHGL